MSPRPTTPPRASRRQGALRAMAGARLRHRVLVIASVMTAVVLGAGPAQAHSDLESANPAVDSTVTDVPDALELTFSDGVQPGFAQIAVLDPTGADVVTADPPVSGDVVSQPVAMTSAGDYGVSYRIVSADGHTIQGTYGFTYTPVELPSSSAAATSDSAALPAESSRSASIKGEGGSAVETAAAQDDSGISGGLVGGILALIAVLGIGGYALVRRRRA